MSKLNIHDIAGLTRYAINAGIIESNVQTTIVQSSLVVRAARPGGMAMTCDCDKTIRSRRLPIPSGGSPD
jgi:hypothetical protein